MQGTRGFIAKIIGKAKEKIIGPRLPPQLPGEEPGKYIEMTVAEPEKEEKLIVRYFVVEKPSDTMPILTALREGYTIAIIDVRPMGEIEELIRAMARVKKTCEAIDGDIAGLKSNLFVATPSFAKVHRQMTRFRKVTKKPEQEKGDWD